MPVTARSRWNAFPYLRWFTLVICFDMWSLNAIILPLIFFWRQETVATPIIYQKEGNDLTWGSRAKRKEKHNDVGVRVTSSMSLHEPFFTSGKSPIISLTIITWKGAPPTVLLAAAYYLQIGNIIFNSWLANTCISPSKLERVKAATQMKALSWTVQH
jgi:hypothetical protein